MMTNKDAALSYIDSFCHSDMAGLSELLADDLQFNGSLFQFHSRDEYLASLRENPPDESEYTILSITAESDSVAVFYLYEKPGQTPKLAQLFRFRGHKISHIDLVFDTRGFHA